MKTSLPWRQILWMGLLAWLVGGMSRSPVPAARPRTVSWPVVALVPYQSGLQRPTHLAPAGDGSGRLFITEQAGIVRLVKGGTLAATPFLDIQARVRSLENGGGDEEGLLSIAFPPAYASKGYFYVYYTNLNGDNQVSRFHLLPGESERADPHSEELIIYFSHPGQNNHNGGQLAFGPDGYLYIGVGDGGGGGDPDGNGQNPAVLLGKVLRIAVEAQPLSVPADYSLYLPLVSGSDPQAPSYRIPEDNPFAHTPGYRPEIWALGLRNPWRFAFDRQNGDLYLADVGQQNWEEVNFQPAASGGGENYGWNVMEGAHCYGSPSCNTTGLVLPVTEYSHALGCSITGGTVYRGSAYPALQGIYLYADYCSGRIWGLQPDGATWATHEFLDSAASPSSFGEDEAGELYLASLFDGVIYRLQLAP